MIRSCFYIMILSLLALPASLKAESAPVSLGEIKTLEEKSDQKKMEYKKLQAESVALSLELAKMNKELVEAAKRVQKDEDRIIQTEKEIELIEKKLKVTEQNFNREHQNLSLVLASLQNMAMHSSRALIFQPLTPIEVIQSAVLMRETIPLLGQNAEGLKKDLAELNSQHQALNQKLMTLSTQTQSLKKKQETIKKLALEKNKIRSELEGESSKAKQEALALASKASDLRDLMEKAIEEAEIKRRKQEELKKAAREREIQAQRKLEEEQLKRLHEKQEQNQIIESENPTFSKTYEEKGFDTIKASDFSQDKKKPVSGQFIRPARGEIVTFYGQELSKGVNSKGIIIQTRDNAQVVAPYDGTVLFSGPFKGYGNLVIISHSDDLVSLIAGMKSNDTENGQMLLAGEPVGLMPDTGTPKLYMEIRKNKKPINPLPWLGQ